MSSRIRIALIFLGGTIAPLILVGLTVARESFWQGDTSSAWLTATNWYTVGAPSGGAYVPTSGSGINARAIIGTDSSNGALNTLDGSAYSPVISSALGTYANVGGLYLGLRERDYTIEGNPYLNEAPAPGELVGSVLISGGTLNAVSTSHAAYGADGRIVIGDDGRGFLTMTGGTLTGQVLVVGGEDVTTDPGTASELGSSLVDLSGSSILTINNTANAADGTATFGRRLRVEGPNVQVSASGKLELTSSNTYDAAITSATAHSSLHADGPVLVGGDLNVEFSGAASSGHVYGQTWDLVDSALGIAGGFANAGFSNTIEVSGLAADPPEGALYRTQIVEKTGGGKVMQLTYARTLVLHVNRDTGEMTVTNPLGGAIDIDAYSVNSALGSMVDTFDGISGAASPPDTGWVKLSNLSANAVGELKLTGSYDVSGIGSSGISLGTGFDKLAVGLDDANFGSNGEDLTFDYTVPTPVGGIRVFRGQVVYEGTPFENNLVLRVNPNTGEATIKNDSNLTLHFDGYSIVSSTGDLSGTGWTGLGGDWDQTPASSGTLSETNLLGETVLGPGAELSIGDISTTGFTTDAAQEGLSLQFILSEGLEGGGAPEGDYNGDGVVDAADYTVWRDGLGTTYVEADYDVWKTNYGATGSAGPPETEYRLGAVVFDTSLSGSGTLVGVPEPGAGLLLLTGLASMLWMRRGGQHARRQQAASKAARENAQQSGARNMLRQHGLCQTVALGVAAVLFIAVPALAATQGITLGNRDFELPGPDGSKVIAFDSAGDPRDNIDDWTFPGPGVEDWGHDDHVAGDPLGDSGTEGGADGNELFLSTLDGVAYQTSSFNVVSIPATQEYEVSFEAYNIWTIDADNQQWDEETEGTQNQLTARLYYLASDGTTRTTLGSPLVIDNLATDVARYSVAATNADLSGALGRPIGVEFDVTSDVFNVEVAHSWAGIDNVTLQITGVLDGDLDGDGDVDATDYGIVRDHLQQSQIYGAQGELNGDGFVDLDDFRLFKTLYAAAAGAGSTGGSLVVSVPEPSTAVLAMMFLAAAALRFRKQIAGRLPLVGCLAAGLLAALVAASPAAAELLYYDPFLVEPGQYVAGDYPTGLLDGQTVTAPYGTDPNFFQPEWIASTEGAVVTTDGLSYAGSPAEGGAGMVQPIMEDPADPGEYLIFDGRTGRYLTTDWDDTTTDTYYLSCLANYGTIEGGDGGIGYRSIEMWPTGGTIGDDNGRSDFAYNQWAGLPSNMRQPDTAKLALVTPDGYSVAYNAPASYNEDGVTHLVVFKFEFSADDESDSVSVYLDPLSITEPDFPSASMVGIDFTLSAIGFTNFGGGNVDTMMMDEIRVGTTFADVLPDFPYPGDADLDGDVDLDDYDIIMAAMNTTVSGGPEAGDVGTSTGVQGSDGRVTIGDFRVWKDNYPYTPSGAGALANIPEPASWLLLLTAMAVGAGLRRRR